MLIEIFQILRLIIIKNHILLTNTEECGGPSKKIKSCGHGDKLKSKSLKEDCKRMKELTGVILKQIIFKVFVTLN